VDSLNSFILDVNDVFWTYLLIPLVVGAALYFTLRSKGVQLRLLPEMVRVLGDKAEPSPDGRKQVSSFGAFTISAAARVGTGNVAGVAAAITAGGAGAVFWMWVMALLGASSAFVEASLAQLYKVRNRDKEGNEAGTYRGGPAYYMQRGLGKRWLGMIFAVVITLTFGFVFNAVQSNTIASVAKGSFGDDFPAAGAGLAVVVLLGLVIFGGVRRIATVTQLVVPVMAVLYLLLGQIAQARSHTEATDPDRSRHRIHSPLACRSKEAGRRRPARFGRNCCRRQGGRVRVRSRPPEDITVPTFTLSSTTGSKNE